MSNVQVAVRVRPLSQREVDLGTKIAVEMRNKSTILFKTVSGIAVGETRDDSKEFEYDHSYWSVDSQDSHFITQEQVYEDLGKSVLESAFQGYNACVFAYGQTGSGKTHTMMGSEENPGLIPRICESLFAHIENGSKRNVKYRVEASYMEIYNEKVRDLLQAPTSTPNKNQQLHNLKVREHPKEGPYVENLARKGVGDFPEISKLMRIGNSHRVTASTKMNDVSSRSHAIFTIIFTQAAYSSDLPCETVSKIHLVDLAGSERVSATGAEGLRLKEGGNINRSLACLGNVISALADMSSQSHRGGKKESSKKSFIPYRNSVLTWLLKDSLGGNSKTIMVATISPAEVNYGETLSTLRYASRAKNIVNKPVVNEDANVRLIRELKSEINRLKGIIAAAKLEDSGLVEQNIHRKEEMIAELTKSWAGKWDEGIQKLVEEANLALHSDGLKMTLAAERPHLLAVDNDRFGGGVAIYSLKNGRTTIGTKDASPTPDIALSGNLIEAQHCALELNEKVRLLLADGKCYVNHSEVEEDSDLSHGDLLQLGESTVFRFNHPEEAQRLKQMDSVPRSQLLPLSPISPTNTEDSPKSTRDLEGQREIIEQEYQEKMSKLREELERKNADDKANLLQELEILRRQNMYTPTTSDSQDDTDNDPRSNATYDLLQSIAHSPIRSTLGHYGHSISDRIVIGKEQYSSPHYSRSPDCASSYQSSIYSSSPCSSPESMIRRKSISQNQIDEDTVDINIVERMERTSRSESEEDSGVGVSEKVQDCVDGNGEGGDKINPTNATGTEKIEEVSDLQFKLTKDKLEEQEQKYKEVEVAKQEVESKLSEAEKKAMSLEQHLNDQTNKFLSEQEELQNRVRGLEKELLTKDLSENNNMRSRSRAFGPKDSPRVRKPYRRSQSASRSFRQGTSLLAVEVPGFLMRGRGWGAYPIYEVRMNLLGEKWSVYKSYAQFKVFYEDITKKYPQLTVLTFPPSKWFGATNQEFIEKRRLLLETFMQSLIAVSSTLPTCPLYTIKSHRLTKEKLYSFSSFFDKGQTTKTTTTTNL